MAAIAFLAVFLCSALVSAQQQLRFDEKGEFRILQVADMHFANGKTTTCLDVLPKQVPSCTDLNTTAFLHRLILAEKPHLIVFTGNPFSPLIVNPLMKIMLRLLYVCTVKRVKF